MLPKSVCRFSVRLLWCWRGPLSGAARGFVLYDVIVSNKLQAAKEETREGHVLSCSHRDWFLPNSVSLFLYIFTFCIFALSSASRDIWQRLVSGDCNPIGIWTRRRSRCFMGFFMIF